MRQTFKLVLGKLQGFLNGNDDHPQIEDNSLTAMIEQAIHKRRLFMSYLLRQVLRVILLNTMLIANKLSSKIFQKT